MSADAILFALVVTILMVVAGLSTKRLELRPIPVRLRLRRRSI